MPKRLRVNREPCPSCPYRRDCPPGVWATAEYEKLRAYDETPGPLGVFLCHQTHRIGPTVCRGWLSVHSESIAVRLAVCGGEVTGEEVYREPRAILFGSGSEAADAGKAGVKRPGRAARQMTGRLLAKGIGKVEDER